MDYLEVTMYCMAFIFVCVGIARSGDRVREPRQAANRAEAWLYYTFIWGSILGLLTAFYGLGVPNDTVCWCGFLAFLGLVFIANNLLPNPQTADSWGQENATRRTISSRLCPPLL